MTLKMRLVHVQGFGFRFRQGLGFRLVIMLSCRPTLPAWLAEIAHEFTCEEDMFGSYIHLVVSLNRETPI